jgi:LmbE family N-acetylglucosaminyl deacetylase
MSSTPPSTPPSNSALKLLCVVAHPDDECFAFGGALALAADAGVQTSLLCFTDGQAAAARGIAKSGADLGRIRRKEIAESCKILGVSHHEVLDYPDGQLEFADFSTAAAKVVERIRRFQPQVVITFGGDGGMNTHRDHVMVSAYTTAGFHWAAQAKRYPEIQPVFVPQRLFHVTTNFFLPDRPPPLPTPWSVTLDIRKVQQRKANAFRAHTSQAPLVESTKGLFEKYGAQEFYSLISALQPGPTVQMTGLFEGL